MVQNHNFANVHRKVIDQQSAALCDFNASNAGPWSNPGRSPPPNMQVFVTTPAGSTVSLEVGSSDTCGQVRRAATGLSCGGGHVGHTKWRSGACVADPAMAAGRADLQLVHAGKRLVDWETLAGCGVAAGSTIHVVPRLRGGTRAIPALILLGIMIFDLIGMFVGVRAALLALPAPWQWQIRTRCCTVVTRAYGVPHDANRAGLDQRGLSC
jgi:hypothetical protein